MEQIAAGRVTAEDGGGLSIYVPASALAVSAKDGINLEYPDVDGVTVEFLIAFVDGRLSWVDRYRLPGGDPVTKVPLVEQVQVSLD